MKISNSNLESGIAQMGILKFWLSIMEIVFKNCNLPESCFTFESYLNPSVHKTKSAIGL